MIQASEMMERAEVHDARSWAVERPGTVKAIRSFERVRGRCWTAMTPRGVAKAQTAAPADTGSEGEHGL